MRLPLGCDGNNTGVCKMSWGWHEDSSNWVTRKRLSKHLTWNTNPTELQLQGRSFLISIAAFPVPRIAPSIWRIFKNQLQNKQIVCLVADKSCWTELTSSAWYYKPNRCVTITNTLPRISVKFFSLVTIPTVLLSAMGSVCCSCKSSPHPLAEYP